MVITILATISGMISVGLIWDKFPHNWGGRHDFVSLTV